MVNLIKQSDEIQLDTIQFFKNDIEIMKNVPLLFLIVSTPDKNYPLWVGTNRDIYFTMCCCHSQNGSLPKKILQI